jgi:putative ABC transport system substrate-binding protein
MAGTILTPPLAVGKAQQAGLYRVGILSPAGPPTSADRSSTAALLPTALRELGYTEGQNLRVERRFAKGKHDLLPGLARELVQLRVGVIVTVGHEATRAAKDATTSIPIVMVSRNVVAQGYVASLAKPGGNITGVVIADTNLADKRLEFLKETVPRITRMAVLAAVEVESTTQVQEAKKAAASLGVTLIVVEVRDHDYASIHADYRRTCGRSSRPLKRRSHPRPAADH